MTDVQDVSAASEPSMEEILASIRRIIADEKDAPAATEEAAGATEEVLELTQMVQDDGSVVDVRQEVPEPEPEPAPEPEPEPALEPEPEPEAAPMNKQEADALLSDLAATAATSSLEALAHTVQSERKASFTGVTPIGLGGRTLEDLVMELMRPMLKEWLDQNLPPVVERIVQKEVERIARRVQD